MHDVVLTQHKYPQYMINEPVREKGSIDSVMMQAAADSAEQHMTGRGRVLSRPSGTELEVRVMIESQDEPQVRAEADQLAVVASAS